MSSDNPDAPPAEHSADDGHADRSERDLERRQQADGLDRWGAAVEQQR
jgi:hypothetical protein